MQEEKQVQPPSPIAVNGLNRALVPVNGTGPNGPGRSDAFNDRDAEQPGSGVTFTYRLWVIRRNLAAIFAFVAACTIAMAIVSYRLTPIYEATATIDVDQLVPTGVVGQEAASQQNSDIDQFLNTQVRLIQSNFVLRPVWQQFTTHMPAGVSRLPTLKVTRLNNTFLVLVSDRSSDPRLAADYANAVAQSYIDQTYNLRYRETQKVSGFMEKQIEEIRAKMERSGEALSRYEQELNMIRPEETNGIVSSRLVQLNTEYTSAEADRVKKESAYQALKAGDLASAQVSAQGEPLRGLVARLGEANEKFKVADRQYGKSHPEYKKALNQVKLLTDELEQARAGVLQRVESEYKEALNRESILKKAVTDTKAEFDRLNARSFEYQNLKREAEADRKLYEELANKIKESAINAGFQSSSIRLADPAELPGAPVYPDIPANIRTAFLCSLFLAICVALAADAMDATLRNPEDVERVLGAHSIGVLPRVTDWQGGLIATATGPANQTVELSKSPVNDTYEDAIRSLRNSILLGTFDQPLRTILVTSASPAEGKTTTAANLAIAHAQQKRKTLLIDCDLRRPGVRKALGLENGLGLSHVLSADSSWKDQLSVMAGLPYLDVLLAGTASRRFADMVGWSLPKVLAEAIPHYDLIIIDSPPVLGFPEPLQLATAVDGVVLVALAGKTNRRAVASVISTLQRLHANLLGVVLNEVTRNTTHEYYDYGYYGKYRNEDSAE